MQLLFKSIIATVVAATLTFTLVSPAAQAAPSPEAQTTAAALLEALEVKDPVSAKYSRSAFKHWIDEDKDGFDTRAEVLMAESLAVTSTTTPTSKTIKSGKWFSPYDNLYFTDASKIDIDHYIALSEAWKSGANSWTATERMTFANDMGYAPALIGVSASQNRSKGDKDPSAWMPSNKAYHCEYVTTWVAVKYRWSLAVDTKEKNAILKTLSTCSAPTTEITTPPVAKAPNAATNEGAIKGTQMVKEFISKWLKSGAKISYVASSQRFFAGIDSNKDGKFVGKEIKAIIRVETHRYTVLLAGKPATSDDRSVTLQDQYTLIAK